MKKKVKDDKAVLNNFILGIILVVVVQTIFMLGGWFIENQMGVAITGIPSAIGLTVVLLIGISLMKKSEYILLGSFTLAFISPLILFILVKFKAIEFMAPHVYYSLIYLVSVILLVWIYYVIKIWK